MFFPLFIIYCLFFFLRSNIFPLLPPSGSRESVNAPTGESFLWKWEFGRYSQRSRGASMREKPRDLHHFHQTHHQAAVSLPSQTRPASEHEHWRMCFQVFSWTSLSPARLQIHPSRRPGGRAAGPAGWRLGCTTSAGRSFDWQRHWLIELLNNAV